MGIVTEKDADGTEKVNLLNYEMCVLQALREKVRTKEIWVVGANRFRNPDDDLPTDFEQNRATYYQGVTLHFTLRRKNATARCFQRSE
jgi:hypothetical protein